jgi:hypothetical protein
MYNNPTWYAQSVDISDCLTVMVTFVVYSWWSYIKVVDKESVPRSVDYNGRQSAICRTKTLKNITKH